jgi:hypothetical protein
VLECHANHDLPLGKFAGARVVRKLAKQLDTFERWHYTHQPQIMHTKLNTYHCDSHVSSRCTGSCASGNKGLLPMLETLHMSAATYEIPLSLATVQPSSAGLMPTCAHVAL